MDGQFLVRQIYDDEITYNLVSSAAQILRKFVTRSVRTFSPYIYARSIEYERGVYKNVYTRAAECSSFRRTFDNNWRRSGNVYRQWFITNAQSRSRSNVNKTYDERRRITSWGRFRFLYPRGFRSFPCPQRYYRRYRFAFPEFPACQFGSSIK